MKGHWNYLKKKLNWKELPTFKVDNKTKHKKITNKEVEIFFETNKEFRQFIAADLLVYEYARKRFSEDIII